MSTLFVDHEHPIWNNAEIEEIDAEIVELKVKLETTLGIIFILEESPVSLFGLWSDDTYACEHLRKWMIRKTFTRPTIA